MIEQFKKEVDQGLSSNPKTLPSKYFYDEIGDDLFVQIMNMPEYYLTDCELEIFSTKAQELIAAFQLEQGVPFEIIELGAGDGSKTKHLLKALIHAQYDFDYIPIDISQNALDQLQDLLHKMLPTLRVSPRQGDYFGVLESLKSGQKKKIVLFMGSNLGNMPNDRAHQFIYQLGSNLNAGDRLLLGLDIIKDKSIVLPAYHDAQGITKAFNLNLLTRINKELGANFEINQFDHSPEFSEETGAAKSFIKSLQQQQVYISSLNKSYSFEEGELIQTEISQKYNAEILQQVVQGTDFEVTHKIYDSREYFADVILSRS